MWVGPSGSSWCSVHPCLYIGDLLRGWRSIPSIELFNLAQEVAGTIDFCTGHSMAEWF